MQPCMSVGASFIEVCRIGVCGSDHADGSISDAIIEIGSKLVQEVIGRFVSGLGGFGLIRADGAEGGKEFVV